MNNMTDFQSTRTLSIDDKDRVVEIDDLLAISIGDLTQGVYAKPNDVVIWTSSLAEGIGTATSDCDVWVLCANRPSIQEVDEQAHFWMNKVGKQIDGRGERRSIIPGDQIDDAEVSEIIDHLHKRETQIDVEYITHQQIASAATKIDEDYEYAMKTTEEMRLKLPEGAARTLHCLLVGIPLQGASEHQEMLSSIDTAKLQFVLYRAYCPGFSPFKDIIGYYRSGQMLAAGCLLRNYLMSEVYAFTFLAKANTNCRIKWIEVALQRLPGKYNWVREDATKILVV